MSASRPCSTGWSAGGSRWSTTGRASRATAARARRRLGDLDFTVIDTAGLEESAPESLAGRMRAQTEAAIAQADAMFFMIDARAGPTPADRAFADLVRNSGKPTVLIANKMRRQGGRSGRLEAYALGLGEPVAISAEHGEGLADLYDALRAALAGADRAQRSADGRRADPDRSRSASPWSGGRMPASRRWSTGCSARSAC